MKIPSERIEGIVTRDPARPILKNINLEKGKLIATDGRMLAAIPAEVEPGDVDGMIPASAFSSARGMGANEMRVGKKYCTIRKKTDNVERIVCVPKFVEGTFPSFETFQKVSTNAGKTPVFKIVFNAEYLNRLSLALGVKSPEGVELSFYGASERIEVRVPNCEDGRIGYLMPIGV